VPEAHHQHNAGTSQCQNLAHIWLSNITPKGRICWCFKTQTTSCFMKECVCVFVCYWSIGGFPSTGLYTLLECVCVCVQARSLLIQWWYNCIKWFKTVTLMFSFSNCTQSCEKWFMDQVKIELWKNSECGLVPLALFSQHALGYE